MYKPRQIDRITPRTIQPEAFLQNVEVPVERVEPTQPATDTNVSSDTFVHCPEFFAAGGMT
jgi:hypothetical protein